MATEEHATPQYSEAPPQEVLVGFIASDVSMGVDDEGQDVFKARFKARGPSVRAEEGWQRGETIYGNLQLSGPNAEIASRKFRDMDAFIASGHSRTYPRDDGSEQRFFFADDIGHNAALMDYTVDRTRQVELRKTWDQEREARRAEQATAPGEAAPAIADGNTASMGSAAPAPLASGLGSAEAPPSPFPVNQAAAMNAREALMQNEQAYASAPPPGHQAPSR